MTDTTRRWLADAAERGGRTALQAYLAVWVAGIPDFDHLFTRSNVEGAVVGLALSLAMSVGAKQRGADDSASLLPADIDPPQDDGRTDLVVAVLLVLVVILLLRVF